MNLGMGLGLRNGALITGPQAIASCSAFYQSPNYSKPAATGTWTATVGSNATNGGLTAPAAVSGAPDYTATSAVGLRCGQLEGALFTMTGTPEASCFVVYNLDTLGADGATEPLNPGIFGEESRGAFGFGVSASGVIAFASDGAYKSARSAATTGANQCAAMRMKSTVDIGATVNGAGWTTTALGTFSPTTTNLIQLGTNYQGLVAMDGRILAIAFFRTRITDAEYTACRAWAQTNYGTP
jgi:hypothetical protein